MMKKVSIGNHENLMLRKAFSSTQTTIIMDMNNNFKVSLFGGVGNRLNLKDEFKRPLLREVQKSALSQVY